MNPDHTEMLLCTEQSMLLIKVSAIRKISVTATTQGILRTEIILSTTSGDRRITGITEITEIVEITGIINTRINSG